MRFVIACVALMLVGASLFLYMLSRNAVDDKSIFADLQFAEVDGRGVAGGVLYTERNGHHMAGVATRVGGRVWVYLGGVDARGGIYSVPGMEQVIVECRLIQELMLSHPVHPTVASALKNSCVE